MKLYKIAYERVSGEWSSVESPSELIVASSKDEAKEKCKVKHPNCEWYGGHEVKVEGYNIIALPTKSTVNETDYIEFFDDLLYTTIVAVGNEKGYELDNDTINNEILFSIRYDVINTVKFLTNGEVDLSRPLWSDYDVGTKFKIGSNKFTIIEIDSKHYGLVINDVALYDFDVKHKYISELMDSVVEIERESNSDDVVMI